MRNQIAILGCDLGSNLGWSRNICTLRPNLHINVVDHGTIYLDNLTTERMRREYNVVYSRRRVRMMIYEEQIKRLVESAKYDCFVTEDVFCNPTRVDAFRSLVLYMDTLERIVNVEKQQRLHTIPPTLIKKHISDYGQSDKMRVRQAILDNKQISVKRPMEATEHEYDSIGAVWGFIQEFLLTLV